MKPSTRYWLKIESFGSPELTTEGELSVGDMAKSIVAFMLTNPLNQRMQFTIARTQDQLVVRKSGPKFQSDSTMDMIFDNLNMFENMSDEETKAWLEANAIQKDSNQ